MKVAVIIGLIIVLVSCAEYSVEEGRQLVESVTVEQFEFTEDYVMCEVNWEQGMEIPLYETAEGGFIKLFRSDSNWKKLEVGHHGESFQGLQVFYMYDSKLVGYTNDKKIYNRPLYWSSEIAKEMNDAEVFDISKSIFLEEQVSIRDHKILSYSNNELNEEVLSQEFLLKKKNEIVATLTKYLSLLQ